MIVTYKSALIEGLRVEIKTTKGNIRSFWLKFQRYLNYYYYYYYYFCYY